MFGAAFAHPGPNHHQPTLMTFTSGPSHPVSPTTVGMLSLILISSVRTESGYLPTILCLINSGSSSFQALILHTLAFE